MTRLGRAALPSLRSRIAVPEYDLARIRPGIVHFGVGGFHRAHQASFIDRLLSAGDREWGICGVGVLPADAAMRDVLADQDNLYTLVTQAPDGTTEARVIGSIVEYLYAPDDPDAVVAKLVDPATRIVSLTITEGGYGINDASGEFEPDDEATRADLAGIDRPRSVLGFIVAALRARRAAGRPPFSVMSCDNIQGNGAVARRAVTAFATHIDPELASWIAESVAFPGSMVDRITPATTDETRSDISSTYGVEDGWPVRAESFEQWVLEDEFTSGRPALEKVGVHVVDDVEPYELMKLRLLNAAHQIISYLGLLDGATYAHEVARDDLYRQFLLHYMHEEAMPTLQPVPGIDLDEYCEELLERFGSEAIRDTLARLATDSSDRMPKFLLPVIREQLARDGRIGHGVLAIAAWSSYVDQASEPGSAAVLTDRRAAKLKQAAAEERREPGGFLALREVFGDLGDDHRLKAEFIEARAALARYGVRGAVERYLQ